MGSSGRPWRRGKVAVTALSSGALAMIWGAVWYTAILSGRAGSSPRAVTGSQVVFFIGLVAAVVGFAYLRANRLSVVDGSALTQTVILPPAADTKLSPTLQPVRERV